MQITLNGELTEVADALRVSDLLARLDLLSKRIAVEVNADLVPRSRFDQHPLAPGDRVEIIQAVGGG
jgi:sulfur carrier protein